MQVRQKPLRPPDGVDPKNARVAGLVSPHRVQDFVTAPPTALPSLKDYAHFHSSHNCAIDRTKLRATSSVIDPSSLMPFFSHHSLECR